MKTIKRVLLLCLLGLAAISASAEVYSGNCGIDGGDNVQWSLDTNTGVLVIWGEGAMKDVGSWGAGHKEFIHVVEIKEGVTKIGALAFWDCSNLTSITIPSSVTSIGNLAFGECSNLRNIVIPNSVTSIESSTFRLCSSLASITIPNSVTSIGEMAFAECYSLTSITIPNSVTSIGDAAFYHCSSLMGITIPSSVTSIGRSAFCGTPNLESVKVEWEKPLDVGGIFDYDSDGNCIQGTLYVPKGKAPIYQATAIWKFFYDIQEYDEANGVGAVAPTDVKAQAWAGTIQVSGADERAEVVVYDASGVVVKNARGNGPIPLDTEGVFIIKVDGETFKVRM